MYPNSGVSGPKIHTLNGFWTLKHCYLGTWTLWDCFKHGLCKGCRGPKGLNWKDLGCRLETEVSV